MSGITKNKVARLMILAAILLFFYGAEAGAKIDGEEGTSFNLTAKADYIVTSDGDSFLMWGYALNNGRMWYPGPTLIVNQGDDVTVTLKNQLPAQAGNVSIVFPGLQVTGSGGVEGMLTREAPPDGTTMVTYSFTASEPGTYLYRSGTRPDLQVEMGLVGALIVRAGQPNQAYNHSDSQYDREFLYLLTEMDPIIHRQVEFGFWDQIDTTRYFATNWFINGRNWPDVLSDPYIPWLPTHPYNCLPRMHPGEKVLLRVIGAGRDIHPMHYHGNNFETIAVDGRLLSSAPGSGADLAWQDNTIRVIPGKTADLIWTWTGAYLGWDIYGHTPGDGSSCIDNDGDDFDDVTWEYCPDHNRPFPVLIPDFRSLVFGPYYSGSPFLGGTGELAPGEPGLNSNGGFFYMWHSHTEKELTSNDIWPGGLVSFMIVEHPDVVIDPSNP
jgi:manganese oxidase